MNSTFRARWLASSEVISQVLFISEQPKKNKMAFVGILSQVKSLLGQLVIACVVYTKTIIHLSVGESGGYFPPLRWIIVNYYSFKIFLRFWLVKTARIIHHNQLLLTKYWTDDAKSAARWKLLNRRRQNDVESCVILVSGKIKSEMAKLLQEQENVLNE